MSVFFVLADHAVVGPMTGIELREATLAGVIAPDSVIGGTPKGPWCDVNQVGLFNEDKVPLPHPPGTKVPRYHVQGMPGAFQGPFKLRELIGFASRGMLPMDCQFQAEGSEDWKPISMLRIIALSVSGDLVLIDREGKVRLRTAGVASGAKPDRWSKGERAPIEVIASVDQRDSTAFVDADWTADEKALSSSPVPPELRRFKRSNADDSTPAGKKRRWRGEKRFRLPLDRINPKIAVTATALLFGAIAGFYWYSNYQPPAMQRTELLGQWVSESSDGSPRFGISFNENAQCVIFNSHGASWTGDYQWAEQSSSWLAGNGMPEIDVVIDEAESMHSLGEIRPSDGYLQLKGFAQTPPVVDGHPVRDLFVRRVGENLQLGYLTQVAFDESGKHLSAAWMTASPVDTHQTNVIDQLQNVSESPSDRAALASGIAPVLSDAIKLAAQGDEKEPNRHESLAVSKTVDSSFLLRLFGVPQEARTVYPFEKPNVPLGPSFDGSQLVRYPGVTLMLNQAGEIQFLRIDSIDS